MPNALRWYRVYCFFSAVLNFALTAGCVWLAMNAEQLGTETVPGEFWLLLGILLAPVGVVFGLASLVLPKLPLNRQSWNIHLVNIVLGLGSVILIPLCLPLLVAWLRPDLRAYFDHGGVVPEDEASPLVA